MSATDLTAGCCSAPRQRPRFFYGWVMLPVATAALIATSPGQTFGVAAFNEPIRASLGLSHAQLTGAYMLGTFLASLPMGLVGAAMDRHGLRATMTVVVLLFGGACVLASQASGLVSLFFAFLAMRMLGQGALSLLSSNTLPFWFERRLGTVEGMRHFGMAGAIATIPALNLWLVDAVGWRWGYALLGVGVWVLMLPLLAFVFRNSPEEIGQTKDGAARTEASESPEGSAAAGFTLRQAARTRAFWIVASVTAFWAMANTGILFNIVPIFVSRGLTEADAAMLFTVFAVSLAVMHLVGGLLADRVPLNLLLTVAAAGMAAAMTILATLGGSGMVGVLGALMGVSQGLLAASTATLWPRYYGRSHLGKIRGSLATVMVASSSVGPFLVGLCRDWTGGYGPVLTVFAILPLPLAVLAVLATRPAHPEAAEAGEGGDPLLVAP